MCDMTTLQQRIFASPLQCLTMPHGTLRLVCRQHARSVTTSTGLKTPSQCEDHDVMRAMLVDNVQWVDALCWLRTFNRTTAAAAQQHSSATRSASRQLLLRWRWPGCISGAALYPG